MADTTAVNGTPLLPARVRWAATAVRAVILLGTGVHAWVAGVEPERIIPACAALAVIVVLGSIPIDIPAVARWQPIVEAVLVAAIIAVTVPLIEQLLPNLIVPTFLAGMVAGVLGAVLAAGLGGVTFVAVWLGSTPTTEEMTSEGQWVILALGTGLLGAWIGRLIADSRSENPDLARYEDAWRLLSQLWVVSRRLSGGLDPAGLAESTLTALAERFESSASILVIGDHGDSLVPLALRGQREAWSDETLRSAWPSEDALVRPADAEADHEDHLMLLPLRVGVRTIGIVGLRLPRPPRPEEIAEAQRITSEASLRLDTALLFDEIRSHATVEERRRLAREIHDGIAQDLTSIGYALDDMTDTVDDVRTRASLSDLRARLSQLITEIRHSIFDLRSDVAPTGLGTAIAEYVQSVGSRSTLTVHLVLDEAPQRLRHDVEAELLRITQEAVTNARKHSGAENLWVTCRVDPPLAHITVEDDGVGLGTGRVDSFGLGIMRERAARINANLTVGPREARGTVVAIDYGVPPPGAHAQRHGGEMSA